MLIRQPTEFVYCCRCEVGFGVLSAKELDDNGYESTAVFAEDCDAEVTFLKKKVIIAAGEFSKFGEDGYTVTAGAFIKLTPKQVQETYVSKDCENLFNYLIGTKLKMALWFAMIAST